MNSTEIRRRFTDFFVERNHRLVPSSPLIPNDPTLLLANAGMNQFKPYFLGEVEPDYRRATSVQKCTRTSDIEVVGRDRSHATFFEMLGNFSFGDYFKEGAIAYAWELRDRAVRAGAGPALDHRLPRTTTRRSSHLAPTIGVPAERIQRLGKEDNYWDMGVPGPCGPCSEIHYDRGPRLRSRRAARPSDVATATSRSGTWCSCSTPGRGRRQGTYPIIGELPEKNIDTGMGLERRRPWCSRTPTSMYETDLLPPGPPRGPGAVGGRLRAGRTEVDRVRCGSWPSTAARPRFLIADGVLPANEGRGYILRRLLRRAVRHAAPARGRGPGRGRRGRQRVVDQPAARPGRSWSPSGR